MMHLELSRQEQEILTYVRENYLSDLRMEIADTDSYDFREGLKLRREVLTQVLTRLRAVQTPVQGE